MTIECGICEYKGNLRDAPSFICFNCGEAIRRLVWISEQKPEQAVQPEPVLRAEGTGKMFPKSAVLGKR